MTAANLKCFGLIWGGRKTRLAKHDSSSKKRRCRWPAGELARWCCSRLAQIGPPHIRATSRSGDSNMEFRFRFQYQLERVVLSLSLLSSPLSRLSPQFSSSCEWNVGRVGWEFQKILDTFCELLGEAWWVGLPHCARYIPAHPALGCYLGITHREGHRSNCTNWFFNLLFIFL